MPTLIKASEGLRMNFKLKQIESIDKKHYKGKVFDLTVEKDHSYNIQGIIVHNSICTTRIQTGHGVPGLQTILDCARSDRNAKIIADGGLKNSGDIVKALAAGADAVMLGSLLAGTSESPGRVFSGPDGQLRKEYRGMASAAAQMDWRGKVSSLEGVAHSVPYKGTMLDTLGDLSRGIRSGLSYSGARSIKELQAKAKWIRQTGASQLESSAHIKGR